MITRARVNYIREDYGRMYTHANHAVAAAAKLQFDPLTARCYYYRGLASYHLREWAIARDDFVESRGCADLFGISGQSIESYIQHIDKAPDPATATIERFPARRPQPTPPRSADDATTLFGSPLPSLQEELALLPSPFSSPTKDDRSAGTSHEDATPQIQPSRRPSRLDAYPSNGDLQTCADTVPNYQPKQEALSEQIRKEILESKAVSLNGVSDATPTTQDNTQDREALYPPSMASTEYTLVESATSQSIPRRVPRPYVAPIATSFTAVESNSAGQASAVEAPDSGISDETTLDGIAETTGPSNAERSRGPQGDDCTPKNERSSWR